MPPPPSDPSARPPDWEATILSIRQARDNALARATELAQRLRETQEQLLRAEDETADARQACTEANRRETAARNERDELQIRLLELNGQRLGYLESEWRATSALSEVRAELAVATTERDHLRAKLAELVSNPNSATADPGDLQSLRERADTLQTEVETLRAVLREREALLETQQRLFEEEKEVLEAQLLATRLTTGGPAALEEASEAPQPTTAPPARPDLNAEELRRLIAELRGDEGDVPSLQVLREQLAQVEQHAIRAERPLLHRITRASLEMILWLQNSPAKIASNVGDLRAGVARIAELLEQAETPNQFHGAVYAVDDDLDNCECIAMAMEKFQFVAKYSAKPQRALEHLQNAPFDLILLDFDMPGMNGIELYQNLRAAEPNRDTPVLFVSGFESARVLVEQLNDPKADFISKPYNLTTLSLRAMLLLSRSAGS